MQADNAQAIRYAASDDEVNPGDHVLYRSMLFWWRWKPGRISYVPGKSKLHPQMEHGGLKWVGVSGADGTFRGVVVGPRSGRLQKSVRFQTRSDGSRYLTPHEIKEEDW